MFGHFSRRFVRYVTSSPTPQNFFRNGFSRIILTVKPSNIYYKAKITYDSNCLLGQSIQIRYFQDLTVKGGVTYLPGHPKRSSITYEHCRDLLRSNDIKHHRSPQAHTQPNFGCLIENHHNGAIKAIKKIHSIVFVSSLNKPLFS